MMMHIKGGLFVLKVKDDELLAEQKHFGNVVNFAPWAFCDVTRHNRVTGQSGEMEEGCSMKGISRMMNWSIK
jgi:hypothetical protein